MDYVAMQSCTSGRNAFFTGMYPLRTGMIPPQLPGSPSYLRPGTPAIAKFLHDLGYTTGEFGKNHLGDHTAALPTAHGFEEYWGYLYHLDAMQQVSFPDINKSPTEQTVAPPCKNTPIPGVPEVPGAVDPKTTTCLTPPRNVLWCRSSDGTEKNQSCKDRGGSANLNSGLSGIFARQRPWWLRIRRDDDETSTPEPQPGFQSESCVGCPEGREDAGRIGATIRRSRQPDHAMEGAASARGCRSIRVRGQGRLQWTNGRI